VFGGPATTPMSVGVVSSKCNVADCETSIYGLGLKPEAKPPGSRPTTVSAAKPSTGTTSKVSPGASIDSAQALLAATKSIRC
jgi:hypothetical protein